MLHRFYCLPLGRAALLMGLCAVFWYLLGRLVRKRHGTLWRQLNRLLALLCVLAIGYATLGNRISPLREAVLVPFHSFLEARTQPEIYRQLLMNVFLFLPLGLTLYSGLPGRPGRRLLSVVLTGLLLSCLIESIQYAACLGRTETDDILSNTLGAFLGCLLPALDSLLP